MSGVAILLDSARGRYIPRDFAMYLAWENVSDYQIGILTTGPEDEQYWDTWNDVLDNATYTDGVGHVWRLYQDGDLFAYCEALMTDEEKLNLFGYVDGDFIHES